MTIEFKTIADEIRYSDDPSKEAYKRFSRREMPYDNDKVIFHFEDQSTLTFRKVYALEDELA